MNMVSCRVGEAISSEQKTLLDGNRVRSALASEEVSFELNLRGG